jgi:hypothetical protein
MLKVYNNSHLAPYKDTNHSNKTQEPAQIRAGSCVIIL